MAIPAGVQFGLAQGLFQIGKGIIDRREGLGGDDRPKYEIPSTAKRSLDVAMQLTNMDLPGYSRAEENISEATSRTVDQISRTAESGTQALAAVPAALRAELEARDRLETRADEFKVSGLQNLQKSLLGFADFEEEQFVQNQLRPWEIQQRRSDLVGKSSEQNITKGVTGILSSLYQAKENQRLNQQLRDIYFPNEVNRPTFGMGAGDSFDMMKDDITKFQGFDAYQDSPNITQFQGFGQYQ